MHEDILLLTKFQISLQANTARHSRPWQRSANDFNVKPYMNIWYLRNADVLVPKIQHFISNHHADSAVNTITWILPLNIAVALSAMKPWSGGSRGRLTVGFVLILARLFSFTDCNLWTVAYSCLVYVISRICYERTFQWIYLSIWNQLAANQRLQEPVSHSPIYWLRVYIVILITPNSTMYIA